MPPSEMYPWSTLENVGDYFVVLHSFKPYEHMNATISIRNRNMRGRIKYACVKTTYGSIVFVAQIQDHVPTHEVEILPGLLARTTNIGPSPTTFGNRPQARELTQREKVDRMSPEMKKANLPWWHNPRNDQLIWNGAIATTEDTDRWYRKEFNPGPKVPYPDYYGLDENLIRKVVENDDYDEYEEGIPMEPINDGNDDVEIDDG